MTALSVITTVLFIVDSFAMIGFLFVPPLRRHLLHEIIRDALDIIKEDEHKKK